MHPELVRKLTKPSKVASLFDWKKENNCTVLILNFHKNRIGIAVAYHPSTVIPSPGGGTAPASCYELEPLRFDNNNKNQNSNNNNNINNGTGTIRAVSIASRGAINQSCLNRFSDIIETYKVCGVIVSWPIQHDTGRMGAACGRVIYALEQLWEQSNGGNNNNNNHNNHNSNNNNNNNNNNGVNGVNGGSGGLLSRPFCLWDAAHIDLKQRTDPSRRVDVFGRCASYGFGSSSSTSKKDSSDEHSITSSSSSSSTATATATVPESNKNKNSNTRNNKYFAGKEQYHEDESTVVVGIWNDFCKEHWPTLTLPTVTATATATQRVTNFQEQQQQAQNCNSNNNNNKSNDNNNYPPENNDQESSLGYDGKLMKVNDVFLLIVVRCLRVTLYTAQQTNRNGSRYMINRNTN
jgi:hypothetical protein